MARPVPDLARIARDRAAEHYLTSGEAGELLGLSAKTVTRYAREGRLPFIRTLGGHRRYPESAVHKLIAAGTVPATADPATLGHRRAPAPGGR